MSEGRENRVAEQKQTADVLISGGEWINPQSGKREKHDVAALDGRIVDVLDVTGGKERIDAAGCLIAPGLCDMHAHIFDYGSELGVSADAALVPMGVTVAVDAGSAGYINFDVMMRECVGRCLPHIYCFLNVSPTGPISMRRSEDVSPGAMDFGRLAELFARYPEALIGLKLRLGRETVKDMGLEPLHRVIQYAEKLECPVAVHVCNAPFGMEDIAAMLREGDIFCHVYHDRGHAILDEGGKVRKAIRCARGRGVLFDAAHGNRNFSLNVARRAMAEGFLPDFLGTDISSSVAYRQPVISLPHIMSKFIALGLPLAETLELCTIAPAKYLNRSGARASLGNGAPADMTLLQCLNGEFIFSDYHGETIRGQMMLNPVLTMIGGKIVYRAVNGWEGTE
jgi:predicted amidohydrolase